jgi:hypothetical protein
MIIYNSLYFYTHECYQTSCMSCKRCNSLYILDHTLVQLYRNNFFSTTMQFPYDYNHNVMFTSFFIHSSKFNTWHYEKNLVIFFWNIDIHHPLWFCILGGFTLWHMAQSKVATWHINWILKTHIYKHLGRSIHNHR